MTTNSMRAGIPERGDVVANAGQDSCRTAHLPAARRLAELETEAAELAAEKRQVEAEISRINGWKREQLGKVYSYKYPKDRACAETNKIEAEVIKRRAPHLDALAAIEERLGNYILDSENA